MSLRISEGQLSRRRVLIGGACSAAVPTLAPAHVAATSMAGGIVFEDPDGMGQRPSVWRGVPGVMVSNGRDVTLTAADGRWRLPVTDGDSVFVIKPSGWTEAGGRHSLPALSRLHQPAGSPPHFDSQFAGVPPTGPWPGSLDFALRRTCESAAFDVLLVADTQPGDAAELSYVRDAVLARVPASGAAFAIHHGDVMGDDLSLLERYEALLTATDIPWHHCPGNHDMNLDCSDPSLAFETWKRVFGPTHYAFQFGGATFLLLNTVNPLAAPEAALIGRRYRGMIGERQLAFVGNVLRHVPRDQLVVVCMHIPLINHEDPDNPSDNTVDRSRLLRLLAGRPHTVSFAGHSHTTEHHYLGHAHGFDGALPHHHHVLTAACGSWWSGPPDTRGIPRSDSRDGSPKGIHVLSIEGAGYTTRFVPIDECGPRQMRLLLQRGAGVPEPGSLGARRHQVRVRELPHTRLLVNLFDGGPRSRVVLELKHATPSSIELERCNIADPFVVDFFARHAEMCKPWVAPAPSSHIWMAPLPSALTPGVHRLRVTARGEYGQSVTEDMLLEVHG